MADANGTVTGVIPAWRRSCGVCGTHGRAVGRGVGLLLKKPDDRAAIRCGLAH
jgi:hypothetical protein